MVGGCVDAQVGGHSIRCGLLKFAMHDEEGIEAVYEGAEDWIQVVTLGRSAFQRGGDGRGICSVGASP